MSARDVHVITHAKAISAFVDTDRSNLVCFRCGQRGHVRFQCLTFKVKRCILFDKGICKDCNCPFAHGEEELRTPWMSRCVRVVKNGGKLLCIGCNSKEHTFRRCPLHSDLMFL